MGRRITDVHRLIVLTSVAMALLLPRHVAALERLCDPAHEDCRAPLIALIDRETDRIDVAFWFMEDLRYSSALVRAHNRGVRVRVIMDTRANRDYPGNIPALDQLQRAGIPMREKIDGGIMHWKMMLFAAQRTVEFSGANFSDEAFVPITPYANYVDEVIYFTEKPSYVQSFMTKFDDVWTAGNGYRNYANVSSPQRAYGTFPIDPELNFPPGGFRERSLDRYAAETQGIDALMYRITDRAHTDALIAAVQRGIPVRLITEQIQYRDPRRLWHSWNVDRLWAAGQQHPIGGQPGIHVRHRRHDGLSHEKLTVLRGQGMAILGSSNWTTPSSDTQLEHNLFTTDPVIFGWSRDHFERKWFNRAPVGETQPFAPLPPDVPRLVAPAPGAIDQPLTLTLEWSPGPWAHRYDVYLGTDPGNLAKIVEDRELGPYDKTWTVPNLSPGRVYYWRVVSRTMAGLTRSTPTCAFRTSGSGGDSAPPSSCTAAPGQPADPVPVNEPQDAGLRPVPTPPPPGPAPTAEVPEAGEGTRGPSGIIPARAAPTGATYPGTIAVPRP
jgi:phosphatidylserine/phosphatidylglycerophosphate/cardiolipin synthase-like enzyme